MASAEPKETPKITTAIKPKEELFSYTKPADGTINELPAKNPATAEKFVSHKEQPAIDASEIMANQTMQQPDKMIVPKQISPLPVVQVSQFVPEVRKWIEGVIKTKPEGSGSTEARFSLNPEHLGPIQIKITTENGKVTAQILTETTFAKEALEGQLPQLRQTLQQQGVLVQKLEIVQQTLQSIDFTQTQSAQTFSQGGSGYSQGQRTNTSTQTGSKKKDSNKEEVRNEMVFTSYGGRATKMTASSIDFTA